MTQTERPLDNSTKSILARGCDPRMSANAARNIPPLIGNPRYVATTSDEDFLEKLASQKWSVVFFAPGACRYDAAKRPIPGAVVATRDWGLDEYRAEVRRHQGDDIPIVETQDERTTIGLLREALAKR